MRIRRSWMTMAFFLPIAASAQFITGPNGSTSGLDSPWKEFKLNTKDRVKVDFRNSNIDNVISFYEKVTGITIVRDPALTGGITLTSAKPVSLNDALQILSTTLSLKGFDMDKEGSLLVIKSRKQNGGIPQIDIGSFMNPGNGAGSQDFMTPHLHWYKIIYANASQLAGTLNNVFTPSTTNAGMMNRFQGGGNQNFQARGIQGQGGNNGRFPGGGGGFPGGINIGGMGGFGGFNQGPGVKAASDDFSNSVIVLADDQDQAQVANLIKNLDQRADDIQQTRVFKLTYAASDDVAPLISNVLTSNVPRGRGGATTGQTQGPGAFLNAIRGSTPGAGQATSDPHTNSIIVTATPENVELVAKVIKDLDQPVKLMTSSFVYSLRNAQSDTVQALLQSAFGNKQGASTQTNRNNTIQPVKSGTQTGTSGSSNTGGAPRTGSPTGDNLGGPTAELQANMTPSLPIALQDPTATSGPLQTNIAVQGFGGGGGLFGGQRPSGSGSGGGSTEVKPMIGLGPNGQVLGYRDLTGQVTVVSDPNTNSLIIVTSPENEAMVRSVLDQLDKIPDQVMIQTVIAEAELDKSDQLGVEWKFSSVNPFGTTSTNSTGSTNFGLQTSTTPLQGLTYTLTGGNVSAYLNALQTNTKFTVLSTPRVFTSNNVEADINISQSLPYITNTTVNALGQNTYAYGFLDVGVVLTVIPHISKDGFVRLEVTQTANDLQGYSSFNAPIVNQREADTVVTVKDGDSVILGGMMQNTVNATVNKVPLLGDIPILGNLFKSVSHAKNRTELLIFMTPHIVRNPSDAQKLKDEGMNELSPSTKAGLDKYVPPAVNPVTAPATAPIVSPPTLMPKKSGGN